VEAVSVRIAQNGSPPFNCVEPGVETISHIRENGRVTIMFNAFEGPPRIMRLYGIGTPVMVLLCAKSTLIRGQGPCTNMAQKSTSRLSLQRRAWRALVRLS